MTNPYESTSHSRLDHVRPRAVRVFAICSSLLAFASCLTAFPALFILNQELGIIPVTVGITDIESDGESVSLHSAMLFLFLLAFAISLAAAALAMIAWYNSRLNRRLNDARSDT